MRAGSFSGGFTSISAKYEGRLVYRKNASLTLTREWFDSTIAHQFMSDVDKKLNEMVETMRMVDEELRKRFGDFDMRDILLTTPSMTDVPSECVIPMDFKYSK